MARTTYHWVLTLNGTINGVQTTAGDYGTVHLLPGTTRSQVYKQLRESILEQVLGRTGALMADVNTVCWSLEKDEL
jgi:FAD/FMN-containing dehydrogenase